MQNKNAVLLFTVLLSLATLYTLSFNWVANNYEEEAANYGAFVADSLESTGEITEDEAFLEFLANFADADNSGSISAGEWTDYYAAVSSSIDNDQHFCDLMTQSWNL